MQVPWLKLFDLEEFERAVDRAGEDALFIVHAHGEASTADADHIPHMRVCSLAASDQLLIVSRDTL